jgi:hypothetical protein
MVAVAGRLLHYVTSGWFFFASLILNRVSFLYLIEILALFMWGINTPYGMNFEVQYFRF